MDRKIGDMTYMCICIGIDICIYLFLHISIHIHVCVYIYIHICICTIYIHTYTCTILYVGIQRYMGPLGFRASCPSFLCEDCARGAAGLHPDALSKPWALSIHGAPTSSKQVLWLMIKIPAPSIACYTTTPSRVFGIFWHIVLQGFLSSTAGPI